MEKAKAYLRKQRVLALAELIRGAVRRATLKPSAAGPVAIWNGQLKRISVEHDSVHDEP